MKEILCFDRGKNLRMLQRRILASFMDLMILSELRERPMSGYDVILLTRRKFGILLGSGSVYSLLYRLERQGLIRGRWNERRRMYKLTPKGGALAEATFNFYRQIEVFMNMKALFRSQS